MNRTPSPLQNRVDPFGKISATLERGMFMGNRGILHNEHQQLVVYPNTTRVPWKTKAWIICRLEFKGRKRQLMSPGTYTELFFLDEATALAAGHCPCAECRRQEYNQFKRLWTQANGDVPIDETLHQERTDHKGNKRTHRALMDNLPNGIFVVLEGSAWLIWNAQLLKWSPGGYVESRPRLTHIEVAVITPRSTVSVLEQGYSPQLHPSADT